MDAINNVSCRPNAGEDRHRRRMLGWVIVRRRRSECVLCFGPQPVEAAWMSDERIAGLRRGEAAARAVLRTAIFTRVSHPAAVFRLPFVRTKGNVIKKSALHHRAFRRGLASQRGIFGRDSNHIFVFLTKICGMTKSVLQFVRTARAAASPRRRPATAFAALRSPQAASRI